MQCSHVGEGTFENQNKRNQKKGIRNPKSETDLRSVAKRARVWRVAIGRKHRALYLFSLCNRSYKDDKDNNKDNKDEKDNNKDNKDNDKDDNKEA